METILLTFAAIWLIAGPMIAAMILIWFIFFMMKRL